VVSRVPALDPTHGARGQGASSKLSRVRVLWLHTPLTHAEPAGHALPHAPQWLVLVRVLTSHPSVATALQSA
jgi:hypothetical protein